MGEVDSRRRTCCFSLWLSSQFLLGDAGETGSDRHSFALCSEHILSASLNHPQLCSKTNTNLLQPKETIAVYPLCQ